MFACSWFRHYPGQDGFRQRDEYGVFNGAGHSFDPQEPVQERFHPQGVIGSRGDQVGAQDGGWFQVPGHTHACEAQEAGAGMVGGIVPGDTLVCRFLEAGVALAVQFVEYLDQPPARGIVGR